MFHVVLRVLHMGLGVSVGVLGESPWGLGGFGGLLLPTGSAPYPPFPLGFFLRFVPLLPSFFPDTLPRFSLWLFPQTFPFLSLIFPSIF